MQNNRYCETGAESFSRRFCIFEKNRPAAALAFYSSADKIGRCDKSHFGFFYLNRKISGGRFKCIHMYHMSAVLTFYVLYAYNIDVLLMRGRQIVK
jgi:hypothetical protein